MSNQDNSADGLLRSGSLAGGVVMALAALQAVYGRSTSLGYRLLTVPSDRIRTQFDTNTQALLLATGLPLVDGMFPSLILAGTLNTISGQLVTAGTVLGGPWMLTIMISEMAGDSPRTRIRRVLQVAALVIPAAGVVAVVAPTVSSLFHLGVFHVFSAVVLVTVAVGIAEAGLSAYLPTPKWIVVTGCVVSAIANWYTAGGVAPALVVDPAVVLRAVIAAAAAFLLALGAAFIGPRLEEWIEIERFRVGSGISLALVPFSIAGILPSLASLAVFGLAVVFALDVDPTG